ncbi:MAG: hypothetical protein R3C44_17715 [Chloroflexota bacterium]
MNHQEMSNRQPRPTEQEIIIWLETADVPLSDDYRRRMAAQPWLAQTNKETTFMESNMTTRQQRAGRFILGLSFSLAVLVLALTLVLTPAGRALAQNVYRYFVPISEIPAVKYSDTEPVVIEDGNVSIPEGSNITVEAAVNEDGSTHITAEDADGDPVVVQIETDNGSPILADEEGSLDVTVTETENSLSVVSANGGGGGGGGQIPPEVKLTVEQAAELVGFPVKEIRQLPDGYRLGPVFTPLALPDPPPDNPGIYFVSLIYGNGADTIQLTQYKQFPGIGTGSGQVIGDEAEVQSVGLGEGITAEYVRGQWIMPETVEPGTDPLAEATWDNDAPDQRLTWLADDVRYELSTTSPDLTLDDLLAMIASLQ